MAIGIGSQARCCQILLELQNARWSPKDGLVFERWQAQLGHGQRPAEKLALQS